MSIVDKFGEKVGKIAENDPVKARKLLLAGYRLQEKKISIISGQKASNVRAVCGKDCHE